MNRAGLFSETNSLVAMTVQIDPWLSAKPRTNPSTPSKAIPPRSRCLRRKAGLRYAHKEFAHSDTENKEVIAGQYKQRAYASVSALP